MRVPRRANCRHEACPYLEPRGANERRQSPHEPAILKSRGEDGIDTRLQRIVVGERDGDRRVIAIKDRQPPAGAQHAMGFVDRALRVR